MFQIISSCEKDKGYPKKYVFNSFYCGDLKAYTNTGEINDESQIMDFIEGYNEKFWQVGYQSDDWQVEIEIISELKAKIYYSDTIIDFDLIHKNGILYFQFTDTLEFHGLWTTDERLKYSPLYFQNKRPIIFVPCKYIIKSNGELHVPIVCYVDYEHEFHFNQEEGKYVPAIWIGSYNNVFNTNYLENLQSRDTIVYQDNKVIFKEK